MKPHGAPIVLYSMDSSALIEIKDVYPVDVFPSLWETLRKLIEARRLWFCEQVQSECHDEALVAFLRTHNRAVVTAGRFEPCLRGLMCKQAQGAVLVARESDLRTRADPFVIALALHLEERPECAVHLPTAGGRRGAVVSMEKRKPGAMTSGSIHKIPDVCDRLQLQHLSVLDFLKAEGYRG